MVSLSPLEISPSFPFPSHSSNSHTPFLSFTGIYPVASLCNTADEHFLQKVAEGTGGVTCVIEVCFQPFSSPTDIPVTLMMDGNS